MSVIKRKRGISRLEFYNNARELRAELTAYLLRNFGIRPKKQIEQPKEIPADEEVALPGEIPDWMIDNFRTRIMDLCRNLMMNITAGNSIYPSPMVDPKTPDVQKMPIEYVRRVQSDELADRRRYQTAAIANCYQLIQELQYFKDVFSLRFDNFTIDVKKLIPYVQKIEKEIQLLKGWRKSTNDLAKKIIKGEN
ncbi:MAG: hypothetical protein FWB95_02485 [Treponema sp.]|nr:hypothetical protein [Treponema sp.]